MPQGAPSFWKEFYAYSAFFDDLTASSGGNVFTDFEIRIDTDADFEFAKTMFSPTETRVRVKYRDDTNGRYLMKGDQDLRTIGGTALMSMAPATPRLAPGFVPFVWPSPYVIAAATTFTVSAADYSNLQRDLYVTFHGSKIRPGKAPWDRPFRAKIPYVYPLTSTGTLTVAANGVNSAVIPTDKDAHFLVLKLVGSRTGPCTVTIKDGARDRQWMDSTALHFDNLVGNGHFPHNLPSPRFVFRGSTVSVTVTDLSGAENIVELNFVGLKMYE